MVNVLKITSIDIMIHLDIRAFREIVEVVAYGMAFVLEKKNEF